MDGGSVMADCSVEVYDRIVCFFKQKPAYELRISDWSSDVCSSDLDVEAHGDGRTLVLRMRIECQCVALTRPPQRVLGLRRRHHGRDRQRDRNGHTTQQRPKSHRSLLMQGDRVTGGRPATYTPSVLPL